VSRCPKAGSGTKTTAPSICLRVELATTVGLQFRWAINSSIKAISPSLATCYVSSNRRPFIKDVTWEQWKAERKAHWQDSLWVPLDLSSFSMRMPADESFIVWTRKRSFWGEMLNWIVFMLNCLFNDLADLVNKVFKVLSTCMLILALMYSFH